MRGRSLLPAIKDTDIVVMITGVNMEEATRLTREGRLQEAMDLLRGSRTVDARPVQGSFGKPMPQLSLDVLRRDHRDVNALRRARVAVPHGASFEERSFSNAAGSRCYKLYVPSTYRGEPVPLLVMLHGCTQDPDDFALGTRMNELAEEQAMLVAYPAQPQTANMSKCWNWFNAGEQNRGAGEPSLIAGITREIMQTHAVRPGCVYIAGLSAGGAAASIMGATHSDLYAAVGVHSGLACGAARDMPSAFAAMKHGSRGREGASAVPTIVFHGDRDKTVHPDNGDNVIAQSMGGGHYESAVNRGEVGGVAYTRTVHADSEGRAILEHWLLHGAGHAWSGGSAAGSYVDVKGPDASREMMRFFRSHRLAPS